MRVSEKSLELNIGAELLDIIRNGLGRPKTYLKGLTQRQEAEEGVDFFVQLDPATRIFAFQFKAPRGGIDAFPYRYSLNRDQHDALFALAERAPNSAFYVLPFYVTSNKLHNDVPDLAQDTWLLSIDQMPTGEVFGTANSKIVRCWAGQAIINPEYELRRLRDFSRENASAAGVPAEAFASWYSLYRGTQIVGPRRRSPWLVRGLQVAIVMP